LFFQSSPPLYSSLIRRVSTPQLKLKKTKGKRVGETEDTLR